MQLFESSEAFLAFAHGRFPSTSPAAFARPLAPVDGWCGDSYQRLVEVIPPSAGLSVLDLACGDGFLLERVADQRPDLARLAGVDLLAVELAAAARRLSGRPIELIEARAQALPFETASFDVVLCHMALMLMDNLDLVATEIRRVLKAGGRLAAMVSGGWDLGPVLDVYSAVFKVVAAEHRVARWSQLGDPRSSDAEGLQQAFSPAKGFAQTSVRDLYLPLDLTPAELTDYFVGAYGGACLSEAGVTELTNGLRTGLAPYVAADGRVRYGNTLRELTAIAA